MAAGNSRNSSGVYEVFSAQWNACSSKFTKGLDGDGGHSLLSFANSWVRTEISTCFPYAFSPSCHWQNPRF
jgi:hypothetical protein